MTHTQLIILAFALGVSVSGCSKKRNDDEPVGVPIASGPSIAPEQGDGPKATTLLPLDVGNTWTYQVTGTSGSCTEGEHTRTITKQDQVGGRSAFISTGFCGNDAEAAFADEGSQVLQYAEGEWRTALASSVVAARTWDFTSDVAFHWRKVGWVQVTAGLFSDCWARLPADESWSQTYCDGVGMVSMSSHDVNVDLKSFNLSHGTRISRSSPTQAPG